MEKFDLSPKLLSELMKYKKHCKYCKHTITFYAFEPDKKLCNFCGRYNYRDEKAEFKDKLKGKIKK